MLKFEKKQIKIITIAIAAAFVMGIIGVATMQSSKSYAAAASNVGVVNNTMLFNQHPDVAQAKAQMESEYDQAKKDFESKSAGMNDKQKQEYYQQTQQRLQNKERELLGSIFDKINASIKKVADAKGLTIVIEKSNVVYGGQDITDEVIKSYGK